MSDREKAIKALEIHNDRSVDCIGCPYSSDDNCFEDLMEDILALLKEQEVKQVKLYGKEEWVGFVCVCPDCKAIWMGSKSETHFCPNCGKAVKWE